MFNFSERENQLQKEKDILEEQINKSISDFESRWNEEFSQVILLPTQLADGDSYNKDKGGRIQFNLAVIS